MPRPELIIFAAIRVGKCIIYGKHHAECIKRAVEELKITDRVEARGQGFLTSKYRFVHRAEAAQIAIAAEQIDCRRKPIVLTSEEFWNEKLGGKHVYDSVCGYMIPKCQENV